jgi:quercetin dioxygenase-like cupin family protein
MNLLLPAVHRHSRLLLAAVLVAVAWIAAAAQTTPTGQAQAGLSANFTGTMRTLPSTDVRASRVQYEPGTRSYWHSHDGLQLLLLERGKGRVQIQGQKMQEVAVGQPVLLAAGVPHWHGAAPDEGLTQIAVNVGGVKWMAAVTDEEYLGKK